MAPKVLAGLVNANSTTVKDEIHAPMGGVRDSGWGRTGPRSLDDFSDVIWINSHSGHASIHSDRYRAIEETKSLHCDSGQQELRKRKKRTIPVDQLDRCASRAFAEYIESQGAPATHDGVAVLSPVTDLTPSGGTYETRAGADPLFTRSQIAELVHSYLGSADARHPLASPLHGRHSGMPSTRIYVGDDEVLLDDSLRYVERAVAAGVDARADVWVGMPHGLPGSIRRLKAAAQAVDAIGAFLAERSWPQEKGLHAFRPWAWGAQPIPGNCNFSAETINRVCS